MSNHPHFEDQLFEQPVLGLFAELGWKTLLAMEETFGLTGISPSLLVEKPNEEVL